MRLTRLNHTLPYPSNSNNSYIGQLKVNTDKTTDPKGAISAYGLTANQSAVVHQSQNALH